MKGITELKVIHREAENGRGDWIRTSDPTVPNRVLYQAEPHPDMMKRYSVDRVVIAFSEQKGQAPPGLGRGEREK